MAVFSDVTIFVFSSQFDFHSIFYKEFGFDFDFFTPVFGVEDINSSALSAIRFAEL